MAKKKGTLKDMVKAPRTIDIDGQLHMLAWITPQEGKTLKELGGAGKKGPMGIPAYPPQGMVGAMGGSATGVSNTSSGSNVSTGGPKGGTGLGSFQTAAGETVDSSRPEFGRGGVADIENVQNYVMNEEGKIVGAYHEGSLPGFLGAIADALGFQTTVYSGDSAYGPGSQGPGDNRGGPDQPITPAVSVAPVEEEEEDTPLTQAMKDYYTMGVGTGTKPLEMTDIIQASESPVGSRYDREKGLLYLADGTIIDVKTGQKVNQKSRIKPLRISGLEMFKPIGG
jgi:hypothetical protein